MTLGIYIVTRSDSVGYDAYDSIVVAAESEADAVTIGPDSERWLPNKDGTRYAWLKSETEHWYDCNQWGAPEYLAARCIGTAAAGIERGYIMGSFDAGWPIRHLHD